MAKEKEIDLSKLDRFIEESEPAIVELQSLLTAKKALAPENGGEGELEKCLALQGWLESRGLTGFSRYDAPDERVPSGIRPNLVLTVPGKSDERAVWFVAHLDVVPAGEPSLWNSDPWTVTQKDGLLFGRGVEDDQQGLVSAVLALLAMKEFAVRPEFTVKVLFCADEEVGSAYGTEWLLENTDIFRPQDLIFIPDGGDSEGLTIEVAEKNLLWLRIHTVGRQAHGSRPDEGRNALLAASDFLLRLHNLEREFDALDPRFTPPRSTFQPTRKESNVPNYNTIPGDDISCMDCRILPCYPLETVRKRIHEIREEIEKEYGVGIGITEPQAAESPSTPEDSPAVLRLSRAIRQVKGKEARTVGIGGGTVAAGLRRRGFLNCAVWSTLDETCHQPNEHCSIANLICDTKVMLRLCVMQ